MVAAREHPKLGHSFEDRVKIAFESNGFVLVEQNQWRKNYNQTVDCAAKREYDLMMLCSRSRQFYIIECKAHVKKSSLVGLGLVKEFERKLSNNNGYAAKRVMVTDTGYTDNARSFAQAHLIELIDGLELSALESSTCKGYVAGRIKSGAVLSIMDVLSDSILGNYLKK